MTLIYVTSDLRVTDSFASSFSSIKFLLFCLPVRVEVGDTNLPNILKVNVLHQGIEISRKCIQPPLKKNPK